CRRQAAVIRSHVGSIRAKSGRRTSPAEAGRVENSISSPHYEFRHQLVSETDSWRKVLVIRIEQPPRARVGELKFAQVSLTNRRSDGIGRAVIKPRLPVIAVGDRALNFPAKTKVQSEFPRRLPVVLQIYAVEPRAGDPLNRDTRIATGR